MKARGGEKEWKLGKRINRTGQKSKISYMLKSPVSSGLLSAWTQS